MLKKTLVLVLLLTLAISPVAMAEVTNRDMQLMGGVVVSNSNDSFFFCPMEEGVTRHWGLYALSSASQGPLVEIQDGYPARLVHADNSKVYFFGYTDSSRTTHALYSVEIATGAYDQLLTDIAAAFVSDTANEFFYVTNEDPFYLCSYSISDQKSTKIKDMSSSKKRIYDAGQYDGKLYFLTLTDSDVMDGYSFNASSGKAINLDKPSPAVSGSNGMLHEGYRIYASDTSGLTVYSMKLGAKKAVRLGQSYPMSLTNPRFGQYMYTYDGENNTLIGLPLDGSTEVKLPLQSDILTRMVLGGSADEILLIGSNAVYSFPSNLSSQTRLFDFDTKTGGQAWTHIVPGKNNAVFILGYGAETMTHSNNMMPTGVYAYDRGTGAMLFGFPEYDPVAAAAQEAEPQASETPQSLFPESGIGDIPQPEREEGETYFVFSNN